MISGNKLGPLRLFLDFNGRNELNDTTLNIGRDKESALWTFESQEKILIYPKRAYDPHNKTELELSQGYHDHRFWQPDFLYFTIHSKAGCQFGLSANFVKDE